MVVLRLALLFLFELRLTRSVLVPNVSVEVAAGPRPAANWQPRSSLAVTYSEVLQPLVNISIGGQWLQLVYDSSSAYAVAFMKEYNACIPNNLSSCFSYKEAEKNGGLHVCIGNNDPKETCDFHSKGKFMCDKYLANVSNATCHSDGLVIDGLQYYQRGLEALDDVMMEVDLGERQIFSWSYVPIRLLQNFTPNFKGSNVSLDLFRGADGILGGSGPSLSCRNTTVWTVLMQKLNVSSFYLDFHPPKSSIFNDSLPSRIVFNEVDPKAAKMLWSQPKQTGDLINDAMHEMLIYKPKVCGVDLLYNASSNWLTILDTSGPCLSFPPFLFDRLRTHIPVDCPFKQGDMSQGHLCSPAQVDGQRVKLPSLSFQLEDSREPMPSSIDLALERLVFRNSSGHELLCVARQDNNDITTPANMMYSYAHIAFGSMVASALNIAVDMKNGSMGISPRGNPKAESSEVGCAKSPTCVGMQSFFPPMNVCEDPPCHNYLFMTVDQETKTCRWRSPIPMFFGLLLATLVICDLASHRLYKQAIQRARDYNQ